MNRMPCSITDGPREDDYRDDYEADEPTYEEQRQQEIDDEHAKRVTDGLVKALPDIMMLRDQA